MYFKSYVLVIWTLILEFRWTFVIVLISRMIEGCCGTPNNYGEQNIDRKTPPKTNGESFHDLFFLHKMCDLKNHYSVTLVQDLLLNVI